MIAAPHHPGLARGSERWISALAVALIHVVLAYALIVGLAVRVAEPPDPVTRFIDISLPPPPPIPRAVVRHRDSPARFHAAPRDRAGGSIGLSQVLREAPLTLPSPFAPMPVAGGNADHGPLVGSGTGGSGSGGTGEGDGGGTDLVLLSGSIEPSDYPRAALKAGVGGRVEFRFTVGISGRVTACSITRSSGNSELDAATCRVIAQRFHYRPSTDAAGHPVPDEVDGEHVWSTDRSARSE